MVGYRRRVLCLIAAAALSASLIAAAAGPASAAVSSGDGLPAVSSMTAARYIDLSDGRFTLDAFDVAQVVPTAAQGTSITVVPGVTLTIGDSGIQLSLSKEAVTEVENVVGFGQSVASLVGSILGVIPGIQNGSAIAGIVASSLGLGSSLLKLCTASDGSATFTVPFFGLPSCSGFSILG